MNRIRPRTRKSVLVIHIVASVALLGEVWGLVVLNTAATLTNDLALAHAAYRLMPALIFAGGIPLSMLSLVSGVLLGVMTRWGLLRHFWVAAKLGLLLATICVGMFAFDPEGMAAATGGAARVASSGPWAQVAIVGCQLVMLLVSTWLSVFKPRLRVPSRTHAQ
jgi:hypothetical protein